MSKSAPVWPWEYQSTRQRTLLFPRQGPQHKRVEVIHHPYPGRLRTINQGEPEISRSKKEPLYAGRRTRNVRCRAYSSSQCQTRALLDVEIVLRRCVIGNKKRWISHLTASCSNVDLLDKLTNQVSSFLIPCYSFHCRLCPRRGTQSQLWSDYCFPSSTPSINMGKTVGWRASMLISCGLW